MPGMSYEEVIAASAEYAARADSIEIPEFVKQRANPVMFTPDRFSETLADSIYMQTGGNKYAIAVIEYPVCKGNRAYLATAVFTGRGKSLSPADLVKYQRKWGITLKIAAAGETLIASEHYIDLDRWLPKQ